VWASQQNNELDSRGSADSGDENKRTVDTVGMVTLSLSNCKRKKKNDSLLGVGAFNPIGGSI